jgi:predicted Zn-dependent protease
MVHDATVTGVPACPSRFELLDSGGKAVADGKRVVIGRKFAGVGYDEDEFAAALAHEFAHNLLAHRAWLKGVGRKQSTIRVTEREADRLMPWLLANAGYPPDAATRFFERWGPGNDGWIFRARTHDGWDERAEAVAAEIEGMRPLVDGDGSADWRTHFVRETAR